MGRGTLEHMLKVSEKKKPLADILTNIKNLSDKEIDAIVSQPTWIRKQLKVHRANILADERMKSMNIPSAKQETHLLYETRQYILSAEYNLEKCSTFSGGLSLSVEHKDLIMILESNKVKINSTVVAVSNEQKCFLIKNSKYVDKLSITAYNEHLQNVLLEKYDYSQGENDYKVLNDILNSVTRNDKY